MDERTLIELKTRLENERVRLGLQIEELSALGRELQSEATGENAYRDHMADQGSATFERELDATLEENLREMLDDVVAALARVEAGGYGSCDRCGAEIPMERLEAVPTASLCITCKSADEQR
ncbi:MAG TPA: TraR/DksA C4-type zinc finger protein [Coriobacteriia bacterium]|nr:TraR/DksA C4-type zinc finger protein [Coriobacteriia bacterium]